MSTKTRLLIFSKDRAVQLLALLESLQAMCLEFDVLDTVVLVKTTAKKHKRQYEELEEEFPNVYFYEETALFPDISKLLMNLSYVLFLVDDAICIRPFCVPTMIQKLNENEDALGFSLRLGRNITYSYPHKCQQDKPVFTKLGEDVLKLNWTKYKCDFGYPMELSSSIYRVSDVQALLQNSDVHTLQLVENSMWYNSRFRKDRQPNLMCFETSCIFSNPMNITGSNSVNRFSKMNEYSVDAVAGKFDEGYKIDIKPFVGFTPIGCHQEVPYSWIRR